MTAVCCAACLQAITHPASPVTHEGRFFHLDHLPAEAGSGSPLAAAQA